MEIKELFRLGLQLMDEAEKAETSTAFPRALLYRDGLIIALFAADPLRLANITALEIGRTLIKDGTTWSVEIPAEETKERRLHLAVLPDWARLASIGISTTTVPCSVTPRRQAGSGSAEAVGRLTTAGSTASSANGRTRPSASGSIRICSGLVLATSTAVHHGAHMGLAMTVLRHQSSKVTERHYNQAKMIDAVRAYQEMLLGDPQD